MGTKKSRFDVLSESHIPSDLLTPTLGSNYGLDGFEDLQYGLGVLEGVLNPELTQAPALPTGLQRASAEDMDLNDMLEDKTPLTDHMWLDPSQLQDPERLPQTPVSIPELEEAWGRSTDGVRVWDRDLDKSNYEESLREQPLKKAKLTREHIHRFVLHAMRRSVRGHDIKAILKEATDAVGLECEALLPYLKPMQQEHGLAGNVFVRASAYPDWGTGRWASEVKKYASRARYIIVSEKDLAGAAWIESGRCKYTSKLAVLEVPWVEALKHYKPLLESTGKKVAGGDPKKSLQAAFLSLPEKKQASTENLPVHIAPSQRVSSKQAREEFSKYSPKSKVYDPNPARLAVSREKVLAKLDRMVSAQLISPNARRRIEASGASPEEMLKLASGIATEVKTGTYKDLNQAQSIASSLESIRRSANRADAIEASSRLELHAQGKESSRRDKDKEIVTRWVNANFVTQTEVSALLSELGSYASVRDTLQPRCLRLAAQVRSSAYAGDDQALVRDNIRTQSQIASQRAEARAAAERIAAYDPNASAEIRKSRDLISRWVSSQFVSSNEVDSLYSKLKDYRKVAEVLKPQVVRVLTTIKKVGYSGPNKALEAQQEVFEKRAIQRKAQEAKSAKEVSEEIERRKAAVSMEARDLKPLQEKLSKVQAQINRGLRGQALRSFFARTVPEKDAPQVMRLLGAKVASAFEDVVVETRQYDKTQFTRHISEKRAKEVLAGQIQKASGWLRKMMTEGTAGKDLDGLIEARISEPLRKAAAGQIQALREQHEGASGFFYVDAAVYASPSGVSGCEKGANRHRANKIPAVAEMARCASCSLVRVLEDGTRRCGAYNKVLIKPSEEDLSQVKEANIRATEMTDAELTTSLFSPNYDPSEFGLENNVLEEVSFDGSPEPSLGDVSFDAWDF